MRAIFFGGVFPTWRKAMPVPESFWRTTPTPARQQVGVQQSTERPIFTSPMPHLGHTREGTPPTGAAWA